MNIKTILRSEQSTKQRAERAIEIILQGERRGWAFDNCFEMGDGDAVYQEIMRRADHDQKILEVLIEQGFGFWLTPAYRNQHDSQMRLF